jgi:hypothetical protein
MKKMIVDILLLILMLIEYSKTYLPSEIHEIIGILLIVLVAIHLALNKKYLKTIKKGKYNSRRKALLIVNVCFFISFDITCLFGILSSHYILPFLNIGNLTIISYHKILAYITLILLGIHLGFNLEKMFKKIDRKSIHLIELIIIILGAYSFIQVDFYNHLTGNLGFSLSTGNVFMNILEYLCIILMITVLTRLILSITLKKDNN